MYMLTLNTVQACANPAAKDYIPCVLFLDSVQITPCVLAARGGPAQGIDICYLSIATTSSRPQAGGSRPPGTTTVADYRRHS